MNYFSLILYSDELQKSVNLSDNEGGVFAMESDEMKNKTKRISHNQRTT